MKKNIFCTILLSYIMFHCLPASSQNQAINWTTIEPPQFLPNPQPSRSIGSKTYTYLKCVYKKSIDDNTQADSSWEWGRNPSFPQEYAKIYGHWYNGEILTNMFYTKTAYQELKDICQSTLRQKNITSNIVLPYASDYSLSYYYTFWSEGKIIPKQSIGHAQLDRMVIFGDSLSDIINVYNVSRGTVPNYNSWFLGHFSNGKLWREYLTDTFDLPAYVWATGNAESGEKGIYPGLSSQLESFIKYSNKSHDYDISQTLFIASFGGNDLISGGKTAKDILDNYKKQLPILADAGAKKIVIMNLPDFSIIPMTKNWNPRKKENMRKNIDLLNEELPILISELRTKYPDIHWIEIDLHSAFASILTDPEFVNTTDACLDMGNSDLSFLKAHNVKIDCKKANGKFIFWDTLHPTTLAYQKIAKIIQASLLKSLANDS
ncbi:thermolabile hemolysin [Providencia alcalifaciens]|nr:thermolabile hemolysin [Providencia alcalifaciens]